jgi:hypothetical protein
MGLDGGYLNPDEVRALEDMPPIPGGLGQHYRQPLNFGPLGYDPTQVESFEPTRVDGVDDNLTGASE